MVTPWRHLAKAITYRALSSFVVTPLGVLIISICSNEGHEWISEYGGFLRVGLSIGVWEILVKPLSYYLHERAWYRLSRFGVKK